MTGLGALGWELALQNGHQWWVLIVALWLMGAPLEELIRLFTTGRIQINVKRDEEPE